MNKITSNELQESYYIEQLDNGLQVVVFHRPEFATTTAVFATPYSSLDFHQIDEEGKEHLFPSGIAHFLEHKMFEMKSGDVMEKFSELGANVNAFTSMTETAYYFSTSNPNIEAPLNLLLDFVQTLEISTESVEKEKGIIVEELNMYQEIPDYRLTFETIKNIYQKHPLKYDIGGTTESVLSTTKEDLEQCHAFNYHPNKMILIVSGPNSPESILEIVKKNQALKSFPVVSGIKRYPYLEPEDCTCAYSEYKMDVNRPKISVSFKLNIPEEDIMKRNRMEWALRFLMKLYFSPMSAEYQTWLDEKKINDYFGYDANIGTDFGYLSFFGENDSPEAFKEFIVANLAKINVAEINEEDLALLKRKYFGVTVMLLNLLEEECIYFLRCYFQGVSFFESMQVINEITVADIEEVYSLFDFNRITVCAITKR